MVTGEKVSGSGRYPPEKSLLQSFYYGHIKPFLQNSHHIIIILLHNQVAIKIIDKTKAKQDSYLWKNLRREVKLLQCMRHPNVVSLL